MQHMQQLQTNTEEYFRTKIKKMLETNSLRFCYGVKDNSFTKRCEKDAQSNPVDNINKEIKHLRTMK